MSENAISEISIIGKEFMGYVKGHFEYTIKVQYENFEEKTAKRRYSEISNLYETLVLKFPGCLIPRIPDKDVFMNLNIDAINKMTSTAKAKIDERTEGLELFFKGIAKNKILRKNKYVLHFFKNKGKLPEYLDDSREDEPLEEYVKFSKEPKTFFSKGKKLVGKVLGYDFDKKCVIIEQRNRFSVGETLELMSPGLAPRIIIANEMFNEEGEPVRDALLVQQKLFVRSETPASEWDIVRRRKP